MVNPIKRDFDLSLSNMSRLSNVVAQTKPNESVEKRLNERFVADGERIYERDSAWGKVFVVRDWFCHQLNRLFEVLQLEAHLMEGSELLRQTIEDSGEAIKTAIYAPKFRKAFLKGNLAMMKNLAERFGTIGDKGSDEGDTVGKTVRTWYQSVLQQNVEVRSAVEGQAAELMNIGAVVRPRIEAMQQAQAQGPTVASAALLGTAEAAAKKMLGVLSHVMGDYSAFMAEVKPVDEELARLRATKKPADAPKIAALEAQRDRLLIQHLGQMPGAQPGAAPTEQEWQARGKELIEKLITKLPAIGIVDKEAQGRLAVVLRALRQDPTLGLMLPDKIDAEFQQILTLLEGKVKEQASVIAVKTMLNIVLNPQNMGRMLERMIAPESPMRPALENAVADMGRQMASGSPSKVAPLKGENAPEYVDDLVKLVPQALDVVMPAVVGTGLVASKATSMAREKVTRDLLSKRTELNQAVRSAIHSLVVDPSDPELEKFISAVFKEIAENPSQELADLTPAQQTALKAKIEEFVGGAIARGAEFAPWYVQAALKLAPHEKLVSFVAQMLVDILAHKEVMRRVTYEAMGSLIDDAAFMGSLGQVVSDEMQKALKIAPTTTAQPKTAVVAKPPVSNTPAPSPSVQPLPPVAADSAPSAKAEVKPPLLAAPPSPPPPEVPARPAPKITVPTPVAVSKTAVQQAAPATPAEMVQQCQALVADFKIFQLAAELRTDIPARHVPEAYWRDEEKELRELIGRRAELQGIWSEFGDLTNGDAAVKRLRQATPFTADSLMQKYLKQSEVQWKAMLLQRLNELKKQSEKFGLPGKKGKEIVEKRLVKLSELVQNKNKPLNFDQIKEIEKKFNTLQNGTRLVRIV